MGPVAPEHARLPAREAVLVEELEVEEGAHRGLAARQQKGVAELARLVPDPGLGFVGGATGGTAKRSVSSPW